MKLLPTYYQQRKLEHLVENRTTYTVESAELNIYETHHHAQEVVLQFNQPVLASMISGKKVMHLRQQDPFAFMPGQSIIMPAQEVMKIDFPEATMHNPTQCLAMTIAPEKIAGVVEQMNLMAPKASAIAWQLHDYNFAFVNDPAVSGIIQRLIDLFTENHPSKDAFVNMALGELIMRILQAQNKEQLSSQANTLSTTNRLAAAIQYVRQHLDSPITVQQLSQQACMSESNFHKVFKDELGLSPIQFIKQERVKMAAQLLQDPHISLREVYLACGFTNTSYFIRTFKKAHGQTPKEFQHQRQSA